MELNRVLIEQKTFHHLLSNYDEDQWNQILQELLPLVHPVDQDATQIWFSFWPLKLARSLQNSTDPTVTVKTLELDGKYRLDQQMDSSIAFFYAFRYWGIVKKAIFDVSESKTVSAEMNLLNVIRSVASQVADFCQIDESVVLGITAAGFMMFEQVGVSAFESNLDRNPIVKPAPSIEQVLRARNDKRKGGILRFFGIQNGKYQVTYEEQNPDGTFTAMHGQDLSMASSKDKRDFRKQDHRRVYGPVPAECRSGACGYCWIGVTDGKDKLSELAAFEKKRLAHFGYLEKDVEVGSHPHIRLSCQAKCHGDVTIVIPPWNGVLNSRRSRLQTPSIQAKAQIRPDEKDI